MKTLDTEQDTLAAIFASDLDGRYGIGRAVVEMRYHGKKVRRAGWNGKGMFLVYQAGYPTGIPINANTARATGLAEGTVREFRPYVMMCTVDGSFVPWTCSQSDLLAEDWETVQ